jgi:tripartite-type tricarboxylate transporter receptor subunit TctC
MVETGKLKMIGLAFAQSLPQYSKYALLTQHAQLKNFVHVSWQSMAVPKSTPQPVVDRLHQDLSLIFQSAEMKELAAKSGSFVPPSLSLAQIEANFNAEIMRTRALAKSVNLQAQ